MKPLANLLSVKNEQRSSFDILLWWELRRIPFNAILIITLIIGLKVLGIHFFEMEMGDGEYFIFLMLVGFIVLCNIAFSFGWFIEMLRDRNSTYAPKAFKLAILLSVSGIAVIVAVLYLLLV